MAASVDQKTIVISMLKSKANSVGVVNTALAGISSLDPSTSSADDIQAQVDAYNNVRSNRANYGNISLPALSSDDALTAVADEAAEE